MNRLNLLRLKNLYGLVADTSGGHLALQVPYPRGDGHDIYLTGYGRPPHPHESDKFTAATAHLNDPKRMFFFEQDASIEAVAQALDALGRHAQAVGSVAKDRSLSSQGRAARSAVATAEALTHIGNHFAKLRSIGVDIGNTAHSLFDPPAVDAVSVHLDVELRTRYNSLTHDDQFKLLQMLNKPEGAQLLVALKRSPLPLIGNEMELVSRAWTEKVTAEKPEAVAAFQVARDNHEWANGLTQLIARTVTDELLNHTAGQLPRYKQYELLKSIGAADLLSVSQSEAAMHDRRIEAESKAA